LAKSAVLLDPATPGESLREEFMVPMGLSRYRLAKETGPPAPCCALRPGVDPRTGRPLLRSRFPGPPRVLQPMTAWTTPK
jgi:hypothetical protein